MDRLKQRIWIAAALLVAALLLYFAWTRRTAGSTLAGTNVAATLFLTLYLSGLLVRYSIGLARHGRGEETVTGALVERGYFVMCLRLFDRAILFLRTPAAFLLFLSLLIMLFVSWLSYGHILDAAESRIQRLTGPSPMSTNEPQATIVLLATPDNNMHRFLRQAPRLCSELLAAGAKGVVLPKLIPAFVEGTEQDSLSRMIYSMPGVIGCDFYEYGSESPRWMRTHGSEPNGIPQVTVKTDAKVMIDRSPVIWSPFVKLDGVTCPDVALVAASKLSGKPIEPVSIERGHIRAGEFDIPIDGSGESRIVCGRVGFSRINAFCRTKAMDSPYVWTDWQDDISTSGVPAGLRDLVGGKMVLVAHSYPTPMGEEGTRWIRTYHTAGIIGALLEGPTIRWYPILAPLLTFVAMLMAIALRGRVKRRHIAAACAVLALGSLYVAGYSFSHHAILLFGAATATGILLVGLVVPMVDYIWEVLARPQK